MNKRGTRLGTRGFVGFVVADQAKIAYNHYDSYPEGLGLEVLGFTQRMLDQEALYRERALWLKTVDTQVPPTDEQKAKLSKYADLNVSEQTLDDWYCLLRRTQGNLDLVLEAGYMADASDFPLDSLFAEWGYLINFDQRVLEVYRGFQHEPHAKGRFALGEPRRGSGTSTYYPCALVATFAFNGMWQLTNDSFLADIRTALGEDEEDDD